MWICTVLTFLDFIWEGTQLSLAVGKKKDKTAENNTNVWREKCVGPSSTYEEVKWCQPRYTRGWLSSGMTFPLCSRVSCCQWQYQSVRRTSASPVLVSRFLPISLESYYIFMEFYSVTLVPALIIPRDLMPLLNVFDFNVAYIKR